MSSKTIDLYNVSEKISLDKLLERETTPVYSSQAKNFINNKVILVTGAGGSIGSEIVRQLVALKAEKIYCLDNDEYSLYRLQLGLRGTALFTDDNIILADIKDKICIARIFSQIKPDIVYHAAAHKHLPLLERSPAAAISTNILGTENIAAACIKYGVKSFVNISTDKAARPTSVLGMTKRLAELCTARHKGGKTKVASVRFGNVLGSRGSFLPTLMWQIANEKPVMVTHQDVSRFFMTISEATALVIEASSMADEGETFILDMGKSIKIVDLIRRYVKMTESPTPKIIYTGLRKGEKLHEELFDPSEIHSKTAHPQISKVSVDQAGFLTPRHKRQLQAMLLKQSTSEELRENLQKLIFLIENRLAAGIALPKSNNTFLLQKLNFKRTYFWIAQKLVTHK